MADHTDARFGARIGDRVLIRGGHPWDGFTGRVVAFETYMGHEAVGVDLDNGASAGVWDRSQLEVLHAEA